MMEKWAHNRWLISYPKHLKVRLGKLLAAVNASLHLGFEVGFLSD
jgi:hypothetical protein